MAALAGYLQRRAPSLADSVALEQLAARFGFVAQSGNRYMPTTVGLMTFGRLPQVIRPEWGVAAVRVDGTDLSDPIAARADLEGTLTELYAAAEAFVEAHTGQTRGPGGKIEPEYPPAAVREALINALVHRDYRLTGRIGLRIFDDRIELWSPGGAIAQFDFDQMLLSGGVSFPRNPILMATARTLGMLEQIGRGLPTMRRALTERSGSPPRIRHSGAEFIVSLPSRLRPLADDPDGSQSN